MGRGVHSQIFMIYTRNVIAPQTNRARIVGSCVGLSTIGIIDAFSALGFCTKRLKLLYYARTRRTADNLRKKTVLRIVGCHQW